jgi:acetylornithine deacetylase/succinyl-diaminopimelate desuccinylase-like protein
LRPAETSREEPIVKAVAKAHREVFGEEVTFADEDAPYRYYWTDACVLSGILKIPTINYGPAGGETVVRPDERVNINQLINAAKVYALTALETCGVL